MKLTLLLDLDDTLISNDMDTFLPGYLKALSNHLNTFPAGKLINDLLAATEKMIAKDMPAQTLEETFDRAFYPAIGASKEELKDTITLFYDQVFPSLQPLTNPIPQAPGFVRSAFTAGHEVVIATNPLFPKTAAMHRLRWAGVSPEEHPYKLITSYEDLHYCKPHLAYYAEILAQTGWPDRPAVMIGNSLDEDILPASRLGLPVFWIDGTDQPLPDHIHPLSGKGNLEHAQRWLEQVSAKEFELAFETPNASLAILKSTPAALDTLTRKLQKPQWAARPKPEEWSVTEVLCHLRDVDAEVNCPRIKKIIQEENPFLPGVTTDPWADDRGYNLQDGPAALDGFCQARTQILHKISNLSDHDWDRKARHAIFGPTRLAEIASFIATHDRLHIRQVCETLTLIQPSIQSIS